MKTLQTYLSASKSGKRNGVIDMRLIDADALKKALKEHFSDEDDDVELIEIGACWYHGAVLEIIDNAPTVERHGKWESSEHAWEYIYTCSNCGHTSRFETQYCCNCGTKMDNPFLLFTKE